MSWLSWSGGEWFSAVWTLTAGKERQKWPPKSCTYLIDFCCWIVNDFPQSGEAEMATRILHIFVVERLVKQWRPIVLNTWWKGNHPTPSIVPSSSQSLCVNCKRWWSDHSTSFIVPSSNLIVTVYVVQCMINSICCRVTVCDRRPPGRVCDRRAPCPWINWGLKKIIYCILEYFCQSQLSFIILLFFKEKEWMLYNCIFLSVTIVIYNFT